MSDESRQSIHKLVVVFSNGDVKNWQAPSDECGYECSGGFLRIYCQGDNFIFPLLNVISFHYKRI